MRSAALAALAAAIGLASSACALAQPMSRAEYEVARRTVESDFRTARVGCEPMRANVRDICIADVTGREGIRLAELEALYQPGPGTLEGVRNAKAQAQLALARERCDDRGPNARESCLQGAEAASVAARADAPVPINAVKANVRPGPADRR